MQKRVLERTQHAENFKMYRRIEGRIGVVQETIVNGNNLMQKEKERNFPLLTLVHRWVEWEGIRMQESRKIQGQLHGGQEVKTYMH